MLITVISRTPADYCRSGGDEQIPARLRQANGYHVRRSSYGSVELEDSDIIVKTDAREMFMRVNLLHRVGLW